MNGDGGVTVSARELKAGDAFDLKLNQEMAFFGRKPAVFLAAVEELMQLSVGSKRFPQDNFIAGGMSFYFRRRCTPGFANGPAKRVAAEFAGDGKGNVGAARLQFRGIQEVEENRDHLLGDVVARERRERGCDLACGAVDGRNEDQEKKLLAQ